MKRASSYDADVQPHAVSKDEFTVRPDLVRTTFQVQVQGTFASPEALTRLQQECEQLRRRLKEATGAEVTLKMSEVTLSPPAAKKLRIPEDDDEARTSVEGTVDVELPTTLDFWARGARLTALRRVFHELSAEGRKERGRPSFSFSAPCPLVTEPEQHRMELLRRFISRVQEFSAAASATDAPLRVVDCTAPGAVHQTPISLEAVGLSLQFSYRLDTAD